MNALRPIHTVKYWNRHFKQGFCIVKFVAIFFGVAPSRVTRIKFVYHRRQTIIKNSCKQTADCCVFKEKERHTVIHFVLTSAKFGTCTVEGLNGTLVEDYTYILGWM
jgi:hypothetical protein